MSGTLALTRHPDRSLILDGPPPSECTVTTSDLDSWGYVPLPDDLVRIWHSTGALLYRVTSRDVETGEATLVLVDDPADT